MKQELTPEEQARAAELVAEWLPWLEAEAREQAMKKGRGYAVVDLEAPTAPVHILADSEHSYRRGYWHGYSQAMDALEACSRKPAWQDVARFFDDHLTPWVRYTPSMEIPPIYRRRATRAG
jgi:hypothetical protein